jgi:phenylalanyl-tRNA synthetase beta chain
MIVSVNWIKEFVDLPDLPPKEMGVRFTMATCEVDKILLSGEVLDKVSAAEIISIRKHPDADSLNLVTVDTIDGKKEVVCGAPNVTVGIKVPYAPLGTAFPAGFTLEPKKIRGVLSEGMLCSEDELGLSDDHSGLLILPGETVTGTTMTAVLKKKPDVLLEIDNKSITHRPDLWGHYGMAREFSAVFGNPLKNPYDDNWQKKMKALQTPAAAPVTLKVDSDSCCLGFLGVSVDNIKVDESPVWIKERLLACGMRPINNIVDISNYVMLELGIPNHIFDRDKIGGGKIHVRRTGAPTVFRTLDEQDRQLTAIDTVVCDMNRPMAIAGIMGGLDSSITDGTTRLFIEAANWEGGQIRKTSTRLGLRTDASQRYEKSLDTCLLERTLLRLVELVLECSPGAKVIGPLVSDGIRERPELKIISSAARISRLLGVSVNSERVTGILTALDYGVKASGENLEISVPSYRSTKDVECEADIFEEIGRIVGYDNIPPEAPLNRIEAVRLSPDKLLFRKIQDFMVTAGRAYEVMTNPMIGEKLLKQASWPVMNEELVLVNALAPEHDRMRPSLIPSLLEAAETNQKHYGAFRFFELGRSFIPNIEDFSRDHYQFGSVFFSRQKPVIIELLNAVEKLLAWCSIPFQITEHKGKNPLIPSGWKGVHPYEALDIMIMGKPAGTILTVHPALLRDFKIKGYLSMAIMDTTQFQEKEWPGKVNYKPLPRFPASSFDCTVVTVNETPVADILKALKGCKVDSLEKVRIVDVYKLDETRKTVTVRATFLDREKTLSGEFLKGAEEKIVSTLSAAGYPLKSVQE